MLLTFLPPLFTAKNLPKYSRFSQKFGLLRPRGTRGQTSLKNKKLYGSRGGCSPGAYAPCESQQEGFGFRGRGVVLGIETSCDDTCAALVREDGKILGERRKSQFEIHSSWGGIVPNLAQDAHKSAIEQIVKDAIKDSGISESEISAVAVTTGPGLSPCLQVGVRHARKIASRLKVPVIPVHHMEAHALAVQLSDPDVQFPFLTLLVSGGHNLLLLAHGLGDYTELGATADDSLGEAYDKVARLLGLDLSRGGGPIVEEIARNGDPKKYPFRVPMLKKKDNCHFSFAGLKTATRMCIEENLPDPNILSRVLAPLSEQESLRIKADIAASFQEVAIRHLEDRTRRALEWAKEEEPNIKHLVVSGGVASNLEVRRRLKALAEESGLEVRCPPINLCTDNGAMVAWAGLVNARAGLGEPSPELSKEIMSGEVEEYVEVNPRWPLGVKHIRYENEKPIKSVKKKRSRMSLTEETRLRKMAV